MAENINNLTGVHPRVRRVLDGGQGESQGVFCLRGTVAFSDASAVTIGVLPANVDVVGITVDVTAAFNAGTTNTLDVGKSGAAAHFKNDLAVGSTGQTVTGWSNLGDVGTSDITVTATYAQSGTAATAGSATVTVFYVAS